MKPEPKKPKPRQCGDCLNCNTGDYGAGMPVCYKLQKRDRKPVAVRIHRNSCRAKDCEHFLQREEGAF